MTREIKLEINKELINEVQKEVEQRIKNYAIDDIYRNVVSQKADEILKDLSNIDHWGKRQISKEVKKEIFDEINNSINKEIERYVKSSFGGKTELEKIIETKVNAFIKDIIENKLEKVKDDLVIAFTN